MLILVCSYLPLNFCCHPLITTISNQNKTLNYNLSKNWMFSSIFYLPYNIKIPINKTCLLFHIFRG